MATKETTVTVSAPAFREILPISPRSVTVDLITHTRKYVIVELDPNLTLQDFNDSRTSGGWSQDRNKALAANDVVELRGDVWTAVAKVNQHRKRRLPFIRHPQGIAPTTHGRSLRGSELSHWPCRDAIRCLQQNKRKS